VLELELALAVDPAGDDRHFAAAGSVVRDRAQLQDPVRDEHDARVVRHRVAPVRAAAADAVPLVRIKLLARELVLPQQHPAGQLAAGRALR